MRRIHKSLSFIVSLLLVISLFTPSLSFAAHDPNSRNYDYGVEFWNDDTPDVGFYINSAANFSILQTEEPGFGTFAGEWTMMNLLRGLYTEADYINQIPNGYFEGYKSRVDEHVIKKEGHLDRNKSTEWSRAILSLTAMDEDITNVAGYDFIGKLTESHRFSHRQGINGPIWILLSLNTGRNKLYTKGEYEGKFDPIENPNDYNTEAKMIDYILKKEVAGGGWTLFGENPDPDITGMALQGLAHYYLDEELFKSTGIETPYEDFAKSVERGIVAMEKMQLADGSYAAFGNTNAESTVQVIVALTELKIDPLTTGHYLPHIDQTVNFTTQGMFKYGIFTNNMIDALLTFWADRSYKTEARADNEYYAVGGFRHIKGGFDGGGGAGTGVNAMATDQSLYGLIAYDRFLQNENSLYDMRDMMSRYSGKSYKTYQAKQLDLNFYTDETNKQKKAVSPHQIVELPELNEKGKRHIGWTTRTDGKGKLFKPKARLSIPSKYSVMGEALNLYAVYDTDTYKLTLHSDGGVYDKELVPSQVTVDDEVTLPHSENMKKKGYQFEGWYEKPTFVGDKVTELSKVTSDVELYAKWTALEGADVSELEKALEQAKALDTEGFTQASVKELNQAITRAESVLEKAESQEEIDLMTEELNEAMKLIVDKTKLQEKIKEAEDALK